MAIFMSFVLVLSSACSLSLESGDTDQDIAGPSDDKGDGDADQDIAGPSDDKEEGDAEGGEEPPAPKEEKQKWLDEMAMQYSSIGHGRAILLRTEQF